MAKQVVICTYTASIRDRPQVSDDLDSLGFSVSKLWDVIRLLLIARETTSHDVGRCIRDRVWSEIGHIPGHNELTTYLKSHEQYDDLDSQSSSFETA